MAISNPFKNLSSLKTAAKKVVSGATDWYHSQIKKLSDSSFRRNPTLDKLEKRSKNTPMLVPGRLYLYSYDPKFKDTLPMYDMFPLLFPYRIVEGGFMGLNLHYLSGQRRVQAMAALIDIFGKYPNRSDMLSWRFLTSLSTFPDIQDCVHRYLWSHVRSPFMEIEQEDWLIASQLPVEKFVYNR